MRHIVTILIAFLLVAGNLFAQPTAGLVAYYPFNGNANDASGNGNNGTVMGATLTTDRFGNQNSAYSFDGINNYITVPNSTSLQSPDSAFTIALWLNIAAYDTGGYASVCVKPQGTLDGGQYGTQIDSAGALQVYAADSIASVESETVLPKGQWFFLALTWDGNQVNFYTDSTNIASMAFAPPPKANTSPLEIGRDSPGLVEYLKGSLDDIVIYNRALTADELKQIFKAVPTSVDERPSLVSDFALAQNYPNPFNPITTIKYEIRTAADVTLKVINLRGQAVRTLANERKSTGSYLVQWDGKDAHGQQVASGVYLYRLETRDFTKTMRMLLLQ